jgi:hypothetical protein
MSIMRVKTLSCLGFAVASVGLAVCLSQAAWAQEGLPNPRWTPGATNPEVSQANIHRTICVTGFARSIRPPAAWTSELKRQQIRQWGLRDRRLGHYEEDHLIALSIGGHPTDVRNLWPQPRQGRWSASAKDDLEFVLYKMVCGGEIGLLEAQRAMASNWIQAYQVYVPSHRAWLAQRRRRFE